MCTQKNYFVLFTWVNSSRYCAGEPVYSKCDLWDSSFRPTWDTGTKAEFRRAPVLLNHYLHFEWSPIVWNVQHLRSMLKHRALLIGNLDSFCLYQIIEEGNGTPLQYSCLESPMDGGAWWAAVCGVARSWTWLSDFTFTFHFSLSCIGEGNGNPLQCSCLENLRDGGAWWLPSMGSHRVGHDWSDLA